MSIENLETNPAAVVPAVTMVVGQGAGVSAAVAVRDRVRVRDVAIARVQQAFAEQGVKLFQKLPQAAGE